MKITNPEHFTNDLGISMPTAPILNFIIGEPGAGVPYNLPVGATVDLPEEVCAEMVKTFPWLITDLVDVVDVKPIAAPSEPEKTSEKESEKATSFKCQYCGRICKSQLGLKAHERACKNK